MTHFIEPRNPFERDDPPCAVCGGDPAYCGCPECPDCTYCGDPKCTINGGPGCGRKQAHSAAYEHGFSAGHCDHNTGFGARYYIDFRRADGTPVYYQRVASKVAGAEFAPDAEAREVDPAARNDDSSWHDYAHGYCVGYARAIQEMRHGQ